MKERTMTKIQFKEAFKRGLGNAFIALQESSSREKYKDIVLWSCLRNTCYDMQSEGGREMYLYRAICLYEDKSFFEEAIIQKFTKKNLNTSLFDQLSELIYLFAIDGSIRARESLYERYNTLLGSLSHRANRTEQGNFEGLCVRLTSLDGFLAFKNIVIQLGDYVLREMDWFYSNAKHKFGEKRVETYLQKIACKNKNVEAYLNSESHTKIPNRQAFIPTLEELINASREKRSRRLALRFAKNATEEDLIKLAKYAIEETNLEIKLELLWTFRNVRFPLDEHFIFELAQCDNQAIRDLAFEIMKYLPKNMIHDYAINLIRQNKELANALSLLCCCYRTEDEAVLIEGVQSLNVSYEDGEWHSVFMDVENLLENRTFKINTSIFIYMYRKTLCSYCRYSLIRKMSKRKVLPQYILEECVHDSYEEIRMLARRKLRRKRM